MKNQKGFIGIGMLIAIIVVALVVGGGVTYFATRNSNNVVDNSQQNIPNNYQPIQNNIPNNQNSNIQQPTPNTSPQPQTPTNTNHSPVSTCLTNSPASIHVTSPNGGETWTRGQQTTVTWTSCNIPASAQLQIDLSESVSSGAHTTSAPIIQSTPNDGSETFTVSPTMWDYFVGPVGYPFKIYITGSVPPTGPIDYSDNSFSIN